MNVKEMEDWMKEHMPGRKIETEASEEELDFGAKLIIDNMVYQKVMYWVQKSPVEVSGLGNVIFEPETNTIRVIDAIMLPQSNTGTSTDIEAGDVAKAMFYMHKNKVPGQLRWWWHSHVNMGVFWSGTDISTIQKLGAGGWFSATVFNKRQEMKSAFCQKEPIRLLVPEIPTAVAHPANAELIKQWDEEYKKNVKEEEKPKYSFKDYRSQEVDEDDDEWEAVVDEEGAILHYRKVKKNRINKSPVERRSLVESSARSLKEVESAIAESDLKDLASDEELDKWERSTSDEEESKMGFEVETETEEEDLKDVLAYMTERDYGD